MPHSRLILGTLSLLALGGCATTPADRELDRKRSAEVAKEFIEKSNSEVFWERYGPAASGQVALPPRASLHRESFSASGRIGLRGIPNEQISISVKDANLDLFLKAVIQFAGFQYFPGVISAEQKVTLELENITYEDLFLLLSKNYRLGFQAYQDSKIIYVQTYEPASGGDASSDLNQLNAGLDITTEIFRLNFAGISRTFEQVTEIFKESGPPLPKIIKDERTNSLIVVGSSSHIDTAAALINAIDVQVPQIMIEAIIIEATSGFDSALGTRLAARGRIGNDAQFGGINPRPEVGNDAIGFDSDRGSIINLPIPGAVFGGGIIADINGTTLKVELEAMASEGLTQIVSNPKIYAVNNQIAEIFQGEEIPYQTFGEGGVTQVNFKEAGLSMKVTPTVTRDRRILLKVEIEKNSANFANALGNNPPIDKRKVTTSLLVNDGGVVAIGGIFKTETRKNRSNVPGFLGKIFNSKIDNQTDDELLIFLIPKVI